MVHFSVFISFQFFFHMSVSLSFVLVIFPGKLEQSLEHLSIAINKNVNQFAMWSGI